MNRVLATVAFSSVNTTSHALLGSWLNSGTDGRQVAAALRTELPDAFSGTGTVLLTLAQPAGSTFGVSGPAWTVGKGWTPGTASVRPTLAWSPQRVLVPAGWTLGVYAVGLGTISGSIDLWDQETARTTLDEPFGGAVATPDLVDGSAVDSLSFMAQRFLAGQRFNKTTGNWEFLWSGTVTHVAPVTFDAVQHQVTRGPIAPV